MVMGLEGALCSLYRHDIKRGFAMSNDVWFNIAMASLLLGTPVFVFGAMWVLKGRKGQQAIAGLAWFLLLCFLVFKSCTAPLP